MAEQRIELEPAPVEPGNTGQLYYQVTQACTVKSVITSEGSRPVRFIAGGGHNIERPESDLEVEWTLNANVPAGAYVTVLTKNLTQDVAAIQGELTIDDGSPVTAQPAAPAEKRTAYVPAPVDQIAKAEASMAKALAYVGVAQVPASEALISAPVQQSAPQVNVQWPPPPAPGPMVQEKGDVKLGPNEVAIITTREGVRLLLEAVRGPNFPHHQRPDLERRLLAAMT